MPNLPENYQISVLGSTIKETIAINAVIGTIVNTVSQLVRKDPFSWSDIFASFFTSGYVGGLILGVGLWIKIKLQERRDKKDPTDDG